MELITRNKTRQVLVGNVKIGGQNKVVIQSMTSTKTSNTKETINQINKLNKLGCEIVRVAIFDKSDALALKQIVKKVKCPIVADIHFDYNLALLAIENGAKKIRINPGNIGGNDNLKKIIVLAKQKKVAIRIGINTGSLPAGIKTDAQVVQLAKKNISLFEKWKFNQIIVSFKSSNPERTERINFLASKCIKYPLHIGVTEAGGLIDASIKSSIGLSNILKNKIGDTIRISIAGSPMKEPIICKKILQNCGVQQNIANIISCPTCGRVQYDIEKILSKIEKHVELEPKQITIAIMGCSVNGLGEAKVADIGIFGGKTHAIFFKNKKLYKTVKNSSVFLEFKKIYSLF